MRYNVTVPKYELRAAYQRDESAEGRCLLDDSPQRLDEHVQARASGGELRSDELGFPVCESDESSSSRDEQSHPGRCVGYTRMEWNRHPSTTLDSASSSGHHAWFNCPKGMVGA
jgi:hypothetical protein